MEQIEPPETHPAEGTGQTPTDHSDSGRGGTGGANEEPQPIHHALTYAELGWPVLPLHSVRKDGQCTCGKAKCKSPGKHPIAHLVPHGAIEATTDPDLIKAWWCNARWANVGIATGSESGLIVLDVDGPEGVKALGELEAKHGPLPRTARSSTGRGRHIWFKHPGGRLPERANLMPGVDVHGDGRYVVAPHEWEVSPDELSEAPKWLLELLLSGETAQQADNQTGSGSAARQAQGSKDTNSTLIDAARSAELWHTPDGEAWATVEAWHWPIRSREFRQWLVGRYYKGCRDVPRDQEVADAIAVLGAQALYDWPEHVVHLRVAEHGEVLWLDLADEAGGAVRITPGHWEVVEANDVPVKFHRPAHMAPLPQPDGDWSDQPDRLRKLVNVHSEDDYRLLLTVMTYAWQPRGPYPILVLNGPPGAAKSSLSRLLRTSIDPNRVPIRRRPREERDLTAAAKNNHVVAFDNLSGMSADMSDALCQLATGGGLGGRRLYTDNEENIFDAQRPIIINGIADLATRGDLADRAIVLELPAIPKGESIPEQELWAEYHAAHSHIVARLLDATAIGMYLLPAAKRRAKEKRALTRMADFVAWGMAVAPALGWSEDDFLAAYGRNRVAADETLLASDPLAEALITLLQKRGGEFSGTASELLLALRGASRTAAGVLGFPKRPQKLGGDLRRLAPTLASVGVEMSLDKREPGTGKRIYTIRRQAPAAEAA